MSAKKSYQSAYHWQGTRINMALIATYLDTGARTAVDIGCNEGLQSCALAESGLAVTGYERKADALQIATAVSQHFGRSAQFLNRLFTSDDAAALDVDVVLFLSVHHQIAAEVSLDAANDMLRALCSSARQQVFFQPACIAAKYGQAMPFADNDYGAIVDYFAEVVGMTATLVGFAQNDLPKNEPLRPMIIFSRAAPARRSGPMAAELLLKAEAAIATLPSPKTTIRGALRRIVPFRLRPAS